MDNLKEVYSGTYVQVREQVIEDQVWERVWLRGGIVIYPFIDETHILLVKEYRPHETPQVRLKPVTGIYEDEFDFKENANREMQEEIGYKGHDLELLYETVSTGTVNNFQKFVIAKNLERSKIPNPDGEHTIQEVIPYSVSAIKKGIKSGEIPLRTSFMGIFLL